MISSNNAQAKQPGKAIVFVNRVLIAALIVTMGYGLYLVDQKHLKLSEWGVYSGLVLTYLGLSARAIHDYYWKIPVKIILLWAFFFFCKPFGCKTDSKLAEELTSKLLVKSKEYMSSNAQLFAGKDSATFQRNMQSWYATTIDTLLNDENVDACFGGYKEILTKSANGEIASYFRPSGEKARLCNTLNEIINNKDQVLADKLFSDYKVSRDAQLVQLEQGTRNTLGPLKEILNGIIKIGMDGHIHPKEVESVLRNGKDGEITEIRFVNNE